MKPLKPPPFQVEQSSFDKIKKKDLRIHNKALKSKVARQPFGS
jgi:hypothetical protein